MIMQCIRQLLAKCPLPTLSELQLCECCWVEVTNNPRLSLLSKQPLGSMVYLSPLPWEEGKEAGGNEKKNKKGKQN